MSASSTIYKHQSRLAIFKCKEAKK